METLESSRVCRLCGQHSGICINIFDKNENHVKKINAVLPILVHEMDLLPKHMCHRCSYKLEEFHKFHTECLKTDMDLKSQLSWMRKRDVREDVRVPMVQIENVKIKSEPPDYDIYELDPIVENVNYISSMSPMTFSMSSIRNNNVNECKHRFKCHNTFANCSHSSCTHCKNNPPTDRFESPTNYSNLVKRNVKRTVTTAATAVNRRIITSTPKNSNVEHNSRASNNADKQSLSKVNNNNNNNMHNIGEVLTNVNQVPDIKIKMEKINAVETRSLRPRKKSVDYLGRKRKKDDNNVMVNPAKRCATSSDIGVEHFGRRATDSTMDKMIHGVRKEPIEEACGRLLRPRTLTVDYIGRKRRRDFVVGKDRINKFGVKEVSKRNEKSTRDLKKKNSNFGTGKCSSGFPSKKKGFKIKEELVSDVELSDIGQENNTRYNIASAANNHVKNLKNLFEKDDETSEISIKVEDEGHTDRDERVTVCSLPSEPIEYPKYKSMLRNVAAKKSLRNDSKMEKLGMRNSKIKKSEPDRFSIRNLNKRLTISQLRTTRTAISSNLQNEIRESINNGIRVPMPLKISDNIKHFCEKCCSSFLNRELYTLHVCYFA